MTHEDRRSLALSMALRGSPDYSENYKLDARIIAGSDAAAGYVLVPGLATEEMINASLSACANNKVRGAPMFYLSSRDKHRIRINAAIAAMKEPGR